MPPRDDSPLPDDVSERDLRQVIARYDSEELTLAEAVGEIGVAKLTMRQVLASRGVELRLGADSVEEVRSGIDAIRNANR
jgi:predicted HTH domain antitoxin